MAHDVFISYSTEDIEAAKAVCAALEAEDVGIRCWYAPRNIRPGTDWNEAIIHAIASSRLMAVILSSNSISSKDVILEVRHAFRKNVTVLPCFIENVTPTPSLEYYLTFVQSFEAFPAPLEDYLAGLVEQVRSFLPQAAEKPQPEGKEQPSVESRANTTEAVVEQLRPQQERPQAEAEKAHRRQAIPELKFRAWLIAHRRLLTIGLILSTLLMTGITLYRYYANQTGVLVKVTNMKGEAISGAYVKLSTIYGNGNESYQVGRTDLHGEYTSRDLSAGDYAVEVSMSDISRGATSTRANANDRIYANTNNDDNANYVSYENVNNAVPTTVAVNTNSSTNGNTNLQANSNTEQNPDAMTNPTQPRRNFYLAPGEVKLLSFQLE